MFNFSIVLVHSSNNFHAVGLITCLCGQIRMLICCTLRWSFSKYFRYFSRSRPSSASNLYLEERFKEPAFFFRHRINIDRRRRGRRRPRTLPNSGLIDADFFREQSHSANSDVEYKRNLRTS